MPPSPVPADPGWDEDLAWLDRDPMTAAEFEASLDRLCEQDEGSRRGRGAGTSSPSRPGSWPRSARRPPMSCSPPRRPPPGGGGRGSPAPRGPSPASRASPAAAFGPGMAAGRAAGLRRPGGGRGRRRREDARFAGVSEAELVGVMCGWDRVEAHAHARKLAAIAELARRNPGELDQEFTADQVAYALGESRARADSLIGMAQTLQARLPGTGGGAGGRDDLPVQGGDHRRGHRAAGGRGGPRRRGGGPGPGGPADPGAGCAPRSPARSSRPPRRRRRSGGRPRRRMPGWSGGCRTPATRR